MPCTVCTVARMCRPHTCCFELSKWNQQKLTKSIKEFWIEPFTLRVSYGDVYIKPSTPVTFGSSANKLLWWPFKWNVFGSTFAWYHLVFLIFYKIKFGIFFTWNILILDTVGSLRVLITRRPDWKSNNLPHQQKSKHHICGPRHTAPPKDTRHPSWNEQFRKQLFLAHQDLPAAAAVQGVPHHCAGRWTS